MPTRIFTTSNGAAAFCATLRSLGYGHEPGKQSVGGCAELTFHAWAESERSFVVAYWTTPPVFGRCANVDADCKGKRAYKSGRCQACESRHRYWTNPEDRNRRRARSLERHHARRATA